MTDREKVIERLEECLSASCRGFRTCPYSDDPEWDAVEAALALLREQEPVKPKTVVRTGINKSPTVEALICGKCYKIIDHTGFNYCPYCGRKVKWDD